MDMDEMHGQRGVLAPSPRSSVLMLLSPRSCNPANGVQDLFLTTDRQREPGPTDYDVKGSDWAGSTTILFAESTPG